MSDSAVSRHPVRPAWVWLPGSGCTTTWPSRQWRVCAWQCLLQEPADVIGKEQQRRDEEGRNPQPSATSMQLARFGTASVGAAPRCRTVHSPECPCPAAQRPGAEPGSPGSQSCQIGDTGPYDPQPDHNTETDATTQRPKHN